MSDPITKAAVSAAAVTTIAEDAYKDLLSPALQNVGDTAGRTTQVALLPLRAILTVAESIEKSVEKKLSGIPKKKIQKPDTRVTLTAINSLYHAADDPDLRDMFANLIANSMISSGPTKTHPAFVYFVNELSAEDAKLIKYLARHARGSIRIVDIVAKDEEGHQRLIHANAALIDKKMNDIQVVRNLNIVVENLIRLRLAEKSRPDISRSNDYIMGMPSMNLFKRQESIITKKGEEIEWFERNIRLTDLGLEFAIAAVYPPGYRIGVCKGCGQKIIEKDK